MYIYEQNTENFVQEGIMMSCGLDYSCTTNQNFQYVPGEFTCEQMPDPLNMLHGTLSYGRRIRYEFLICYDLESFVALRLFVDCSEIVAFKLFIDCIIFFKERFSPGRYY